MPRRALLDIAFGGAGNLHCDIGRYDAALDRDEEPLLSVFEQITDRGYVIGGEVDFRGDFGVVVAPLLEGTDWLLWVEPGGSMVVVARSGSLR